MLYALAGFWVPLVRPLVLPGHMGDLPKKLDNPVLIEVVPNLPTSVQLSPSTLALKPGQSFEVEIMLTTAYVTRGTQFGLSYDPRLIEITKIDEGEYYRVWAMQNKASTIMAPGVTIDAERGLVRPFGVVVLGGTPTAGPNGRGLLATIEGRAKPGASGTTTLRLEAVEVSSVQSSQVNANGSVISVPSFTVADAQIAVGDNATPPAPPTPRPVELHPDAQS
jgi:hypothetical protein